MGILPVRNRGQDAHATWERCQGRADPPGRTNHTSWAAIWEVLQTHQVLTIVLPTDKGMLLKTRKASIPEPRHIGLYKLLSVPGQIKRPKKTLTGNARM